jgi:integrase
MEKKEREFLTKNELHRIEIFSTTIDRLTVVKDLFLFSCYTGISYCDIMDLDNNSVVKGIDGNFWLMANRNKTGTPIKVPILPLVQCLIDKYKNNPRTIYNGKLLPTISNQKLNSYLKELADLCSIKKNLTFHMARHTFATTVTLTNGVPLETVSKLLGHSKLATTQIYARVIEKKLSEDMELLKQKLG